MGFEHIAGILQKSLAMFPHFERRKKEGLVISRWENIVGKPICNHALPEYVRNGILILRVSDSVWMQELQFYKEQMLNMIEMETGERVINDIHFRIGSIATTVGKKQEAIRDHFMHISEKRKDEIERILSPLRDKALKEGLRRLFLKAEKLMK